MQYVAPPTLGQGRPSPPPPKPPAHRPDIRPVPSDLLGVVTFGAYANVVSSLAPIESEGLAQAFSRVEATEGQTNLTAALRLAHGMLSGLPQRIVRRITVISDGEQNPVDPQLSTVIQTLQSAYIGIDAVAVGASDGIATLKRLVDGTVGSRYEDVHVTAEIARAVCGGPTIGLHRRQGARVLLIDVSGSMNTPMPDGITRLDAARYAAKALLDLQRKRFSAVRAR